MDFCTDTYMGITCPHAPIASLSNKNYAHPD